MQPRRLAPALVGLILLVSGAAQAHFALTMPPAADTATDGGKGNPPCGPTSASGVVTAVQGGHALPIVLTETVMHPGHYRIALSVNSRAELPADPMVMLQGTSTISVSAAIQNPVQFPVLADNLFPHTTGASGTVYRGEVTLPNITCAKCTLQVIEFMAQHGPNVGGGYYYHHCADLKITADPALPGTDAGAGTTTDAGQGTGGAGTDAARGTGGAIGTGAGGVTGGGGSNTAAGGSNGAGGKVGGGDAGTGTPRSGGGCQIGTSAAAAASLPVAALGLLAWGLAVRRRRGRR
jgi:hypothetical protein